ncbi:MAG TPA: radical SAM family heme chaperone HemW [Candidatus Dormibacteraeota bacterium]|nr:radical SAM family heme chaperone HemW [Candidatus Dormibacteraeota bacterium]
MTLGIYVQVPFCQAKCTYCNFHTGVFSASLYAPYTQAVCREIREHASLYKAAGLMIPRALDGLPVDTIYIGGGTPSLLEPLALANIIETICAAFSTKLTEVTLEADPETVTPEKAAAWRTAGINRISLGAQSFTDVELKAAGRMHRCADIFQSAKWLRQCGFANVSFDLIAGLPHQTRASWEKSLDELFGQAPEHVSIYLMEIDEASRLGREVLLGGVRYGAIALPSDDAMAEFYESACVRLAEHGYEHYEISNWGRPGRASRHNLKYWRREPYLGFGAGAHSFNGRERWANAHDPSAYAASVSKGKLPVEQVETVTAQQALEEELFLGLRQLDGIDLDVLENRYSGCFRKDLRRRVDELATQGLVEQVGSRVRLAAARLAVSNEVFVALMAS